METLKEERAQSPTLGFLIQFEAKDGKADEIEKALDHAVTVIEEETGTIVWFAFRTGGNAFGVFDAFYDEAARMIHWEAGSKGLEKLEHFIKPETMVIKKVDIVQAKLNRR